MVSVTNGAITNMIKIIKKVTLDDLKSEQFLKAVENGEVEWHMRRLTEEEIMERLRAELMRKVALIRKFASNAWKHGNRIDALWESIFEKDELRSKLMYQKGKKKGELSMYKLFALVKWMTDQDQGIYMGAKTTLYCALNESSVIHSDFQGSNHDCYKVDPHEERMLNRLLDKV